jgi:uncharacterized protein YaiI (UPF0178 family)
VPDVYVDADACPVKQEVLKVAERHGLPVHLVSNTWMRGPDGPLVRRVVVAEGPDAADDWIAERAGPTDIVVTSDVPLAARCVPKGAKVMAPTGRLFTPDSIGMQLATRDLMTQLRETGEITSGPRAFRKDDRSRFLQALEQAAREVKATA